MPPPTTPARPVAPSAPPPRFLGATADGGGEEREALIVVARDGWPSTHGLDRGLLPDLRLVGAALEPAWAPGAASSPISQTRVPPAADPRNSRDDLSLPGHRRAG